jgi:hypothetical protein
MSGPPAWRLGMGLTNFHLKKKRVTKYHKEPRTWTNYFDKRPKRWNIDMRIGTWNIRNLYWVGSLIRVPKELSTYRLDLVGVLVRWVGSNTEPAGEYTFFN